MLPPLPRRGIPQVPQLPFPPTSTWTTTRSARRKHMDHYAIRKTEAAGSPNARAGASAAPRPGGQVEPFFGLLTEKQPRRTGARRPLEVRDASLHAPEGFLRRQTNFRYLMAATMMPATTIVVINILVSRRAISAFVSVARASILPSRRLTSAFVSAARASTLPSRFANSVLTSLSIRGMSPLVAEPPSPHRARRSLPPASNRC